MSPRFTIVNPCSKRWSDLRGDGRERYCDTCQTPVHAVEAYSEEEWARVTRESGGRVCGLLGGESAPEPRSRRAVPVGALLTAISPLMAQTGRVRIRVVDAAGAPLATAQAGLLGSDGRPMRTMQANGSGEIVFAELPMGDNRFEVFATGFRMHPLTVTVRNSDEMIAITTLDVGLVGEFVGLARKRSWWHRLIFW